VDTGAGMTVIPQKVTEKLQLKPIRKMTGTLAAGKTVTFPIYYMYLNVGFTGQVEQGCFRSYNWADRHCHVHLHKPQDLEGGRSVMADLMGKILTIRKAKILAKKEG